MFVFGGKDASGNALNDLWWVDLDADTLEWTQATISDPPPIRYGHVAMLARPAWAMPKMIIFGGRNQNGFNGDTLWALNINREGSGSTFLTWTTLTPTGTSPGQREGQSAIVQRLGTTYRGLLLGGISKGMPRPDSLMWKLDLAANDAISWSQQGANGTPPMGRMRQAAAWDEEWNRMVVFGGDTTTATGGGKNDLWELPLEYAPGTDPTWISVPTDTTMPDIRWGHTLIFDQRGYDARLAELFTPNASTGTWDKHTAEPEVAATVSVHVRPADGHVVLRRQRT